MKKLVCIRTQFTATHNWTNAPIGDPVNNFLRFPHRHIFHVELKVEVTDNDREVEFFDLKDQVDRYILLHYSNLHLENVSCEMIAEKLLTTYDADFVSVYEDNENGCEISK